MPVTLLDTEGTKTKTGHQTEVAYGPKGKYISYKHLKVNIKKKIFVF